jgi:hypothetical protein
MSQEISAQTTIASFSSSKATLSSQQKGQIKVFLDANPSAASLTCTVFTRTGDSKSKVTQARNQSTATCKYAKQLIPALKTSVSTKATNTRSLVGRINLLAKSPQPTTGNPIPVVNPEPPSLKPITPWMTDLSAKTLGDGAQVEFRKWAKEQTAPTQHQVLQNGNLDAVTLDTILKGDAYVAKLFSQYIPGGSYTLISDSGDWIRSKANELGIRYSWGCDTTRERFNYCLDNYIFTGYTIGGRVDPGVNQVGMNSLPMHEYFHNVQSALSGTPRESHLRHDGDTEKTRFPAWWHEGAADFVGFMSYAEINKLDYSSFKALMMSANPGQSPNANALKDYEIRRGEGNGTIIYPYNMGRIAVEYLVASAGFQKMLDVHLDYRLSRNFRTSFNKVYGFPVEEFYEKFEKIRLNVGLPPVTMEIRGTENLPKP